VNVNSSEIKLQIWDTAGQERFKSVARTYYRGAIGAIILFDLTALSSYQAVSNWIQDVRELAQN
jgi:Ras-related protein Rab-4B